MERFWDKVDVGEKDECWEWTGGRDPNGYGTFWYQKEFDKAHRVVMRLQGHDVRGATVCHKCDNPSCVNPNHLWVGTQQQNMRDMTKKGRNTGMAPETAYEIRLKHDSGVDISDLAEEYDRSWHTIRAILLGERFKDAGGPTTSTGAYHELPEQKREEVRQRYKKEDISIRDLAEDYPVSHGTIYNIVS